MGRRNLADIDRINLARRKEDIVRLKAKANQLEGQKAGGLTAGNGREKTESSLLAKLPESNSVNTRKEVAKAAGVGERTYDVLAFNMWLACYTQEEIAEAVGVSRKQQETLLRTFEEFRFCTKLNQCDEIEDNEERMPKTGLTT